MNENEELKRVVSVEEKNIFATNEHELTRIKKKEEKNRLNKR